MSLGTIFLIASAVCFTLGALGTRKLVGWTDAGFAFAVASLIV